LVGPFALLVV
jgi:hypothetical protein